MIVVGQDRFHAITHFERHYGNVLAVLGPIEMDERARAVTGATK
jgi:hypothetical protein